MDLKPLTAKIAEDDLPWLPSDDHVDDEARDFLEKVLALHGYSSPFINFICLSADVGERPKKTTLDIVRNAQSSLFCWGVSVGFVLPFLSMALTSSDI